LVVNGCEGVSRGTWQAGVLTSRHNKGLKI